MIRIVRFIDSISTLVGKTFAWLIVVLTLHVCWEVAARYILNQPSAWAFDLQMMYYGILFMMAGAYTLAKNGHVRGDILYGFLPPRVQAGLDLLLFIVFFFPGVIALVWAGWYYAGYSIAIREHSSLMANGPPIYPFKAFIPAAGAVLLLQGVAEVMRCILCLKQGAWPSREEDVEEVDIDKLKEMVHVKDEDIAQLDRYVTPGESKR
ncbi:TRAP transporter small permease subunit [Achromobacter mucicolens]|uniref:TRAP transporter small permease subunit n=1 Tax=Achromobacter mucicolens TaxID=1389922 RepID=UPI0022F3CE3D|nr:TRAP transporter small permease subunit [Achromobacter mucicolens]WBX91190.1 TRAP transporter small permease subunit [Achromobacter mucicolens]